MRRKRIAILFISTLLLMTIFASAGYSGWKKTGSISGFKYQYRSGLNDTYGGLQGRAHADVLEGKTVPAKYIGGRSYIYNKKGTLFAASDWAYNRKKVCGTDFNGKTVSQKGSYYCIAKFKFKKSNGTYTGVYTAKATNYVNLKSGSSKAYPVSSSDVNTIKKVANYVREIDGVTYGSGLRDYIYNEVPDMISAVGVNGKEGFIRSDDLTLPSTGNADIDGVALSPGEKSFRYVSVYSEKGEVIDRFVLYTEYAENNN